MPDTQPQFSLRQLARDYAENRIDKTTYRDRRSTLLDRLASTSLQLVEKSPTSTAEKSTSRPASNSKKPLLLILPLILLALIGGVLLSLNDSSKTEESTANSPDNMQNSTKQQLEDEIKAFIDAGIWHHQARVKLLKRWHSFDSQTHLLVRQSHWFRILEADLRTLIKEEQSLANEVMNNETAALISFARNLKISVKSSSTQLD
jgi:hypothetical protein